uniref:LsmAD domain-containing protein n=1 Tax=Pinguiococcus pyrenoidosus TaxID=172671 RepID=A0A7R9U6S8_9STRA
MEGEWDQFQVNKDKFDVKDTFDMDLYTTALDESKLSAEQRAQADQLARKISRKKGKPLQNNLHMRLERGELDEELEIDEETLHSGVVREESSPNAAQEESVAVDMKPPIKETIKETIKDSKETEEEKAKKELQDRIQKKLARHRRQFSNRATLEEEFSVGKSAFRRAAEASRTKIASEGVEETKGERPASQETEEEDEEDIVLGKGHGEEVVADPEMGAREESRNGDADEDDEEESDDEDEILLLARNQGIHKAMQRVKKRSEEEEAAKRVAEQRKKAAEARAKQAENAKHSSRVTQLREMTMQNVLSSMNAKTAPQPPAAPAPASLPSPGDPTPSPDGAEAASSKPANAAEKDVVYFRPALPGAPVIAAPKSATLKAIIERVAAACCKNPMLERVFKEKAKGNASYREQFAFLDSDDVFHQFYVFRKQVLRSQ